jgi:hypothetical protein
VSDSQVASLAIPALKLLLSPALLGVASWISRRWGPGVAGWFSALPFTSGPVVLVLALERGSIFAAETCAAVVLAVASLAAFAVTYAWSARRVGRLASAALGCVAYLVATWSLRHTRPPLGTAFMVVCLALLLAILLMPRDERLTPAVRPPTWDIPLRMALAGAFVWALTQSAGAVGPRLSGLLTPFPVAATILASFTHRFDGSAATARLLRNLLAGLFSFALFFLVVGELIERRGIATSFVAGIAAALAMHPLVWISISREGRLTFTPLRTR